MGIFTDPMRAPCGHTYCDKCIKGWLRNNDTCPEDRQVIKASELHKDFVIDTIIKSVAVRCPYFSLGCAWRNSFCKFHSHIGACKHNPQNQPDWLKARQEQAVEFDPEDDVDVDFLEQAKEEESPPPASLMMRLLQKDKNSTNEVRACTACDNHPMDRGCCATL
eukprot:TRINITY_DN1852_c0_g1_i1.p1 TRINITY_DN1852_c0_g1~~TRINITY_DN1852_c0_g1_i1.p1  ORF type:complete len:164 (-),score=41.56 TRINITY_DN1852_c0_g1_i1:51-542(-)